MATLYSSADQPEGARAFAEKRRPRVEGMLRCRQHGHGHGHGCAADHHRGEYTERQRADLDLVLAFNHRLAQAVEDCTDITDTVATLDPDPLRYMWVDEGDGQIPAQLAGRPPCWTPPPGWAGRPAAGSGWWRAAATRPGRAWPRTAAARWSAGWSGRRAAATGCWPS